MKSENRKYLAADSAAQQLKLNIKAGATQSSVQTTESFRKFGGKKPLQLQQKKAIVRKPADFSGNFLRPYKLSISNQNRTVSRG